MGIAEQTFYPLEKAVYIKSGNQVAIHNTVLGPGGILEILRVLYLGRSYGQNYSSDPTAIPGLYPYEPETKHTFCC